MDTGYSITNIQTKYSCEWSYKETNSSMMMLEQEKVMSLLGLLFYGLIDYLLDWLPFLLIW